MAPISEFRKEEILAELKQIERDLDADTELLDEAFRELLRTVNGAAF